MTGAWILLDKDGKETNLYTREAVDMVIKDKEEYTRGAWKLFREGQLPNLVENDGSFQLLNKVGKHYVSFTNNDCLREIMIAQNLPK